MACRFASFLLLTLLTTLAARAAELVVVDARGVNLRPGSVVDSANPLVLKDGQRVTLIAANGSTLKLQGPFDGPIEAGGAGEVNRVAAALKLLVVQKDARLSEIGTVRAALRGREPPQPWLLDVSRSGNLCIKQGEEPVFWREVASETSIVISPSDRSWSARAPWAAESDRLVIPALLPLRDRGAYLVQMGNTKSVITVNVLPQSLSNDEMRLAWMLEKGCQGQASALARTLP